MMKALLFPILIFFSFSASYACSVSLGPRPFCEIAPKLDVLIASGKIIEEIPRGYLVQLHTVYKGDETRSEVKIFEQGEWDCNGLIFNFSREILGKLGDVILFVTASTTHLNNPEPWYEPEAYYNIYSKIGSHDAFIKPLLKKGNTFKGLFSEGVESIKEDEIAAGLLACGVSDLLAEPRIIAADGFINIYPNPAKDQVFIDNLNRAYEATDIYDLNGKIVYRSTEYSPTQVISTEDFSSGLYIVVVKSSYAIIRKKLVITD